MRRLLIANRGEIAVRIIRAARALGIETVAIYSDADRDALHVRLADVAAHVGPTPAPESYLNIDGVIAAAREHEADAIHPGYGFLSENAAFAERCEQEGITFVGPSAAAMRALGDKERAKEVAAVAKVPTVPTYDPANVPRDAFPVLVKAAAGGGGRGMRVVRGPDELQQALESARREALAGFGDDTLLVERLVTEARHVEVQLLADEHGTCLYVGDRDCSLQRRHQKVVEEAPAPGLSFELRRSLGEAAVRLARESGYVNAGTAEFLVDASGHFYFLELNARLQVEHPATELAFDIDLVCWQLRIAQGERLTLVQDDIVPVGHAIEARLYAEDPVTFLPTGGRVLEARLPQGEGIRVDHALREGMEVSLAYDPLLAKVIATGPTREAARVRLLDALRRMTVLGVLGNQALLQHALRLHDFVAGTHHIGTLEANLLDGTALEPDPALAAQARRQALPRHRSDPFDELGTWRVPGTEVTQQEREQLGIAEIDAGLRGDGAAGMPRTLPVATSGDRVWFAVDGITYEVSRSHIDVAAATAGAEEHGDRAALTAPMPGTVIKAAEPGTQVKTGDPVVVLEAMKMENAIASPFDGVVEELSCNVGDLVPKGAVLAEVGR